MSNARPYLSKGIYCMNCNDCICKPSRKKYPDPDFEYEMLCEACTEGTPFLRAFMRLRKVMDIEELNAFEKTMDDLLLHSKELENYCLKMHGEGMPYNDAAEKLSRILDSMKHQLTKEI